MDLKLQKRLAGQLLKCSTKKIWCDPEQLKDLKEAITKTDIRRLVTTGMIRIKPKRGVSRSRARHIATQKSKGLRKHAGSRKGPSTSRLSRKDAWMNKIRLQRKFLAELKLAGYLDSKTFRELYLKSKGGFFRSIRHIKLYGEEHKLFKKQQPTAQTNK